MKIEKLTENTYRVRQQYQGRRYAVYFDHKPNQKEALRAMLEELDKAPEDPNAAIEGSMGDYINRYLIALEKKGASPSTLRGHDSIVRNLSDAFKDLPFAEITNADVQKEVNLYSEGHSDKSTRCTNKGRSPKSVKCMYGLIRAVFSRYRPELILQIKLPTRENKAEYEPTTEDIQRVLDHAKGTKYYVPLRLASLGLRRGEILALTLNDLDNKNVLTINKDVVSGRDYKYVVKDTAKTQASNRRILIPDDLADMIRAQGYFWPGHPNSVGRYLRKTQDALGIPRFRFHMLRHFCVAYLHQQGFSAEQIMAWGGWETDNVMKNVYRYNLDPHESMKDISERLGSLT